jgi:hypothetical protein
VIGDRVRSRPRILALLCVGAVCGLAWMVRRDLTAITGPRSSSFSPGLAPRSFPAETRIESPRAASGTPAVSVHPQDTERPHPITSAHESMQRGRELIGAATSRIADRNYREARRWLQEAQDQSEHGPEAFSLIDEVRGYLLIVDCLEALARQSSLPRELHELAENYIREQRLPPRREVRRVCLQRQPFARGR